MPILFYFFYYVETGASWRFNAVKFNHILIMKAIEIVRKLVGFSPRQFEREKITKNYIVKTLNCGGLRYRLQDFSVLMPVYEKYYLRADGKRIECLPTSLRGGKINAKFDLINSLDYSDKSKSGCNVNYNPHCDHISLANYYNSPSFAVSRKDAKKINESEKVEGFIKIKKKKYTSCNILAGNNRDPRNIIFAHYDCFFDGAIDNASGVAVCMSIISNNREALKDNLFVFCGAEELSFDKPDYWGKCFRVFEMKNKELMKNAEKIVIVDCVGTAAPELKNDDETVSLYFAKKNNGRKKILVITSVEKKPERFLRIYHSKADKIGKIREKYLQMAVKKCLSIIK